MSVLLRVSRSRAARGAGFVLLCGLLALRPGRAADAAPPIEFHVSPGGRDANPGTASEPVATPGQAQRLVRQEIARGLRAPVTVWIHGGRYELSAALVFGPGDSGTETCPILYAAHGNERPVLSGGRFIRGWQRETGEVWTVRLPEVQSGRWDFRQLFRDGERLPRARHPNGAECLELAEVSTDLRQLSFRQSLPFERLDEPGAEVVVLENWAVSRARVLEAGGRHASAETPVGWVGHQYLAASPGKPAYLENARAFLDQPGEWCLRRDSGVLSWQAQGGEDPNRSSFVAPVLGQLLRLEGRRDAPVQRLSFRGLAFEHTEFPLPSIGYAEVQAGHYGTRTDRPVFVQPLAVQLAYAAHCRFERCRFAHLGGSGLGFGPGCKSCVAGGCEFADIAGNGAMVGWRGPTEAGPATDGGLDSDWRNPQDAPFRTAISYCLFDRCAATWFGCVGVFVAFARDTRVVRNEIRDLPYTGLSLGYRWNARPSTQRECLVEGNHIHHVMQLLADGGGIYTLGAQPGTTLRQNLIHDVPRSSLAFGGAPNNGIFLDAATKGLRIEGNIIYQTSGEPVRFNETRREWQTWGANRLGPRPGSREFPTAEAARLRGRAGLAAMPPPARPAAP